MSEFRGFMLLMGHYHLAIKEREIAECYHYLAHKVDPRHPGTKRLQTIPKEAPSVAPRNSDGAKMPPEPPPPNVMLVISGFSKANGRSHHNCENNADRSSRTTLSLPCPLASTLLGLVSFSRCRA